MHRTKHSPTLLCLSDSVSTTSILIIKRLWNTQPDQNSNRTITVTGEEASMIVQLLVIEHQCITVYHAPVGPPLFQDNATANIKYD